MADLNPTTAAPAESTGVPAPQAPSTLNVPRAKRAIVLNAHRNSPQGQKLYADALRRQYNLPSTSKLNDQEVIQSAFDDMASQHSDLTPEDFTKDLHTAYGDQVDTAALKQAKKDYPSIAAQGDSALIDHLYKTKLKNEEAPPIDDAAKVDIVKRRWPKLAESDVPTDKALKEQYTKMKGEGKAPGSYQDWLHDMAAPTLADRYNNVALAAPGAAWGFIKGLGHQVKTVGSLANEVSQPGQLVSDIALAKEAGDSPAGQEAVARLKEAGHGAVNVGALGATIATGGALGPALEGGSVLAPMLGGAAEGIVGGGLQGAGDAAVEGKGLGEIGAEAARNAAVGGVLGGIAGSVHGHVQRVQEAADSAQLAAENKAAIEGAGANLPKSEGPKTAPPPVDEADAFRRHAAEMQWAQARAGFGAKHDIDPQTVDELLTGERRYLSEYGVTPQELQDLRAAMPEHLKPENAVPVSQGESVTGAPRPQGPVYDQNGNVVRPAEPGFQSEPATAEAVARAPEAPPGEPGMVKSPLVANMTEALQRAKAQLPERAKLRRQALSERFAAAQQAGEAAGGGMAGWKAKLSAMRGEIKKPDWAGVSDLFDDVDFDHLHTAIMKSSLTEGDKLTAGAGLNRLFGLNGSRMGAPTLSQIDALKQAFGTDFVEAAQHDPTFLQQMKLKGMQLLNTPRTAMATMDVSMAARQGYLMASQPEYRTAVRDMLKAFKGPQLEEEVAAQIKATPNYDVKVQSGLFFQGEPFMKRGEQFAGSLIDNWIGVKNSEAAAHVFLNKIRSDMFDRVYADAKRAGVDVTDPHFRESLAQWLNTSTGRGNLSWFGRDANILNGIMFSPRLFHSRLETFNPGYYMGLHPFVRQHALAGNASVIGGTMALMTAAAASGVVTVNLDPRSSDFAKMKIGHTRIDMFAGHQQIARVTAQLLTGKVISSTTGREIDLNGADSKNWAARQGMTRLDVASRFMEAKAAPVASFVLTMLRGKDFTGAPTSVPNEVLSRFTPLVIEDMSDAYKDAGIPRAAVVAPLALVGVGTQTYGPSLPGQKQANTGVVMSIGKAIWDHVTGVQEDPGLQKMNARLAEQWVKDAAMAQVYAHNEATQKTGFWDKGFDQQGEIRKVTARRMAAVNKLYKELAKGGTDLNSDSILRQRAVATGMNIDALRHPNTELTEK